MLFKLYILDNAVKIIFHKIYFVIFLLVMLKKLYKVTKLNDYLHFLFSNFINIFLDSFRYSKIIIKNV